MGERIRTLGWLNTPRQRLEVELNGPPAPGFPQQIHIQSEKFRIELDKAEFVRAAIAINVAAEKLRHTKDLK